MGELHQERAPAGKKKNQLAMHPPDLTVAPKKPLAAIGLDRNFLHAK
jgi:hypothetical protein